MKTNIFRLFGIIALAAIIGFSFAACGDDGDEWERFEGRYICIPPDMDNGMVIDAGKGKYTLSEIQPKGSTVEIVPWLKGTYTYTDKISYDATLIITELNMGLLNGTVEWKKWEEAPAQFTSSIPGGKERIIKDPPAWFRWFNCYDDESSTCSMGHDDYDSHVDYRFYRQDRNFPNPLSGIWKMDAPPAPVTSAICVIGGGQYLTIINENYNQKGDFVSYPELTNEKTGECIFRTKYNWNGTNEDGNWAKVSQYVENNFTCSLSGKSLTLSGGTGEAAAFNGKWTRQ